MTAMHYLSELGLYASNLLATTLKVAYPTWASYKAIVSEEDSDDTTWLIFWVVVAIETFIESYVIPFVSWVPYFMIVRVLFYVWLQMPIFNGSIIIYKKFVKPFFEENSETLNAIINVDSEEAKRKKIKARKEMRLAYFKILASIDPKNDGLPKDAPWLMKKLQEEQK